MMERMDRTEQEGSHSTFRTRLLFNDTCCSMMAAGMLSDLNKL